MIEEKAKPFRLVKYFTFSSLTVIFMGTIVLSVLNTHWARSMHLKQSQDYARLLVENLNHQVFLQFIIPVALKYGKIQLSNKEQFDRMDKVVRSTLHSFHVEMVNIYDMNEVISYSLDPAGVGAKVIGSAGYQKAVEGKSSSRLIQKGNFIEIIFGFPEQIKIVTFAPLRAEKPMSIISGPVIGVMEIVQDLSSDYQTIFRFQILVMMTSTVVMGVLLLILIYVVKRGEGIIQKRTLERIRLKEKLNHAERLSSIGEMVAGISHEIRNPLGIIRSSAQLLKKKIAAFDPKNTIPDIIVEESNRLNNIITDFLNFAKPRNPNRTICHVDEILKKNIYFLSAHLQNRQYGIYRNYGSGIPEIHADFEMIYQAFLNILLNAMQAMPDGGDITIDIDTDKEFVTVCFLDKGGGVPTEILNKIWDPFFTTKETGTGLGLGIVKNIIESHSGTIQMKNQAKGTVVKVQLPIYKG